MSEFMIDFGPDAGIGYDFETALVALGLSYSRVGWRFILPEAAVETLRRQPLDANGGIGEHDDGEAAWLYGYAYPVTRR